MTSEPQATKDDDNPYQAPGPVESAPKASVTFFAKESTPEGELFTATFVSMGCAWVIPIVVFVGCSALQFSDAWCEHITVIAWLSVWFILPLLSSQRLFNA